MTQPATIFGRQPAGTPLLVGRAREAELLRDHLAAVAAGHGRLVLVGGEAGIGKTTLVRAIAHDAAAKGALVLSGAGYDLIATPPYGPWRELIAGYRPAQHQPPPPIVVTDGAGGEFASQDALFAQIREFFAALTSSRPLVLVLEDLHWADPASLDLLRYLARQLAGLPLLLLVTYRSDELTRRHPLYLALPILVREGHGDRIDLRRLDDDDVRALVAAGGSLDDEDTVRLVAYLQAHAEGNPFHIHELLRTLVEAGVLRPRDDRWVVGELGRVRVPELLRQVVDGRLARLGEETREPLALAAVIGQEAPFDLWRIVSDVPEDALLTTVDRAFEAHLLEATADGRRIRFTHALIREALYEGVLPPRRRSWHRRIGEALAATPGADPDAVAYHLQQAGDDRAADWLMRAGERAQRAYARVSAAERFVAVAALLDGNAARARERGWLLHRIGRLLRNMDPVRGIAYLEEAERVAAVVEDRALAAFALADRGLLRCFAGEIRAGLADLEAGNAALDAIRADEGRSPAVATAWEGDTSAAGSEVHHGQARRGTLVLWLAHVGRYAEVEALAAAYLGSIADEQRAGEARQSAFGDTHFGLGLAHAALGRLAAARQALARAHDAYRAIDHRAAVGMVLRFELMELALPYQTGHLAERRRLAAAAAVALARAGGALTESARSRLPFPDLLLLEGDWTEARRVALAACSLSNGPIRDEGLCSLGALALLQGSVDEAREFVRDVLPEGPTTEPGGNVFRTGLAAQRVGAAVALEAGDLATAHAWLTAHDRWLAWSGSVLGRADGLVLWARYHRAVGDAGQARRCAADALAGASEPRQPLALLAAHRVLGELATDARETDRAEQHLQAARDLATTCAAPYERALTLLALAELRAASRRPAEARELVAEVRAICEPLGAAPTLARADAVMGERPAAVGYPAGLTPRECEVVRLVAAGLSNAQVAETLFVSPATAKRHVANVLLKLDLPSRSALNTWAHQHHLA